MHRHVALPLLTKKTRKDNTCSTGKFDGKFAKWQFAMQSGIKVTCLLGRLEHPTILLRILTILLNTVKAITIINNTTTIVIIIVYKEVIVYPIPEAKLFFKSLFTWRWGPRVGEVTCGGLPHLTCTRDHIKIRDYMDRKVTPPKRVTSPTWGPHLHVNRP